LAQAFCVPARSLGGKGDTPRPPAAAQQVTMFGSLGRQLRVPRLGRGVSQALVEPMAWNQAPALVTTLPSGLRVASREAFGEVSTLGIFVDAGVRSETKETIGVAHLVERLALRGTKQRPRARLEAEVESMGGTLSVNMGREQTAYTMSVFNADIKQGVDILADVVMSPDFENLAKHREGILRSVNEVDKPTRMVIEDRLHACAYRDCSLGFSAIGPYDALGDLTTAHLQNFVDANYTAENMVFAASGPIKHEELVKLAEAHLGGIKAGPPRAFEGKPYFTGSDLTYRNDEMGPTAYLSVGWEGVPYRSPDAVTFMLMQHIIGSYKKNEGLTPGNISGNRTINNVANKMGVGCADEFESFNIFYKDTGMFGWYAVCDEVAVEHCQGELMFGVNMLAFSVTDEEVERGKRDLKNALFGGPDSTEAKCSELGSQVLAYGRGLPHAEMALRIDAIDAEEVHRVAFQYLNDAEIAVTGLGPLHGMPHYMDMRRATTMHRY